jgi:hypothetical protein
MSGEVENLLATLDSKNLSTTSGTYGWAASVIRGLVKQLAAVQAKVENLLEHNRDLCIKLEAANAVCREKDEDAAEQASFVCPGCQRNEVHKMCPACHTPFYMSGVAFTPEIEVLFPPMRARIPISEERKDKATVEARAERLEALYREARHDYLDALSCGELETDNEFDAATEAAIKAAKEGKE